MPDPANVNFTAVPFSAHAQSVGLRWPVPLADSLKRVEAGEFVWRRLQYVFDGLADPAGFSGTPTALEAAELDVLRRFVAQARRLAGTSFMAAEDRVTINIPDEGQGEEVVSTLSDEDVTAGHMVFLRQCFADDEEASFSKARKLLEKGLHADGPDGPLEEVKRWRKAHAAMLNQTVEELVQERMVVEKLMPGATIGPDGKEDSLVVRAPASPSEMLRTFWYGDQIHWGKHRNALAAVQTDPFWEGMWEISARQAAVDFAHFYCGFAVLLDRALDGPT